MKRMMKKIGKGKFWEEPNAGIEITIFCEECDKLNVGIIPWRSIRAALKRKDAKQDKDGRAGAGGKA